MKIIIKGVNSGYELTELLNIVNNGNWDWYNFETGDIVWVESSTHLPLPNLMFVEIENNKVILSA